VNDLCGVTLSEALNVFVRLGEVMSPDYIADTLNHPESDVQGYPYHMLVPHGLGKITYKSHDDVLEQYEGNF